MYFGLPVVTTGWGGQLDFCNQSNSFLIDFNFVSSQSHFELDLSYWAEPSQSHLGELMLSLYNSGPSFTSQKVALAKDKISNLSSYRKSLLDIPLQPIIWCARSAQDIALSIILTRIIYSYILEFFH